MFEASIHATYSWALAGAPWSVVLVDAALQPEPQELSPDQFVGWMDRLGEAARLLNSPAGGLEARSHRYFLVPKPAAAPKPAARRQLLQRGLLALAPQWAEALQMRWQQRWLPPGRRRWQALRRDAATPAAPASSPGEPAFILGLHWLALGGAESFAVACVEQALQSGRPVFVLCEHPSPAFYPLPAAVQVLLLYALPSALRSELIVRLAQAHPGSLIHIHHCISLYGALARLRHEVAQPLQVVDSLHIDEQRDGGFVRVSSVWGAYLDQTHVISARLREQVLQRGGLHRDLRLGYLVPDGAPADLPQPRLPRSLAAGRLHLCMVSRMVWQKRPILTLRLAEQLMAAAQGLGLREVRFTVIGSGPLLPAVQRRIQRMRCRCTIELRAASPEASALFAEADLLLQCSANEGITLTSFEALARGCLVLSTNVGAQSELIAAPFLLPADGRAVLQAGCGQAQRLLNDPAHLEQAIEAQALRWQHLAAAPRGLAVVQQLYARLNLTANGCD